MICPACQSENADGSEICFTCGHALSASAAIRKGSLIAGRYEILSPLGKGGMGIVYKAHDRVLEETVALKVLRSEVAGTPEMARRFRSEIKLARKVTHKNVCRIHEYGAHGDLHFISMEFIEGVDLRHVLRSDGPLPTPGALNVAVQIADGLEAIHEVGIIHRDLKTPNLMRDAKGVVRLMDFGIAKHMDSETHMTGTGAILGTPEYMSPEQVRGEKIDARSDLYAMGIVIFELFTGDVPFRGDTPLATIFKHMQEPPPLDEPRSQRVPNKVKDLLRKMLAKNPGERPATAAAVGEALRQIRSELLPELQTPTSPLAAVRVSGAQAPALAAAAIAEVTPLPTPLPARTFVPQQTGPLAETPAEQTSVPAATAPVAARTSVGAATEHAGVPPAMRAEKSLRTPPPASIERAPLRRTPTSPGLVTVQKSLPPQPSPVARGQARARTAPRLIVFGALAAGGVALAAVVLVALRSRPVPQTVLTEMTVPPPISRDKLDSRASTSQRPTSAQPSHPTLEAPPTPRKRESPIPESVARRPAATPAPAPVPSARSLLPWSVETVTVPSPTVPPASSLAPSPPPRTEPAAPAVAMPPPQKAIEPQVREPPREPGLLQVVVTPWADVFVDGVSKGTTPFPKFALPPGAHTVQLRHPAYEIVERRVTIRPGDTETLRVDLKVDGVLKR